MKRFPFYRDCNFAKMEKGVPIASPVIDFIWITQSFRKYVASQINCTIYMVCSC